MSAPGRCRGAGALCLIRTLVTSWVRVYVVRDQVLAAAGRPDRLERAAADAGPDRGRRRLVELGVLGDGQERRRLLVVGCDRR